MPSITQSIRRLAGALGASAALTLACGLAHAQDKLTFLTSWYAQAEHGGYYQAVAKGIYARHGLDVTIKMGGPQVNAVQLLEEACSTQELIDWDAAITQEDREILEATDADACIDTRRKVEFHMPSDKPGLIIRRQLMDLLTAHGESESFRA